VTVRVAIVGAGQRAWRQCAWRTRPARRTPERDKSEPHAPRRQAGSEKIAFESFRVEVGHVHVSKPGNIVGAIANEAGLEGRHIGHVDIREDHSFVDSRGHAEGNFPGIEESPRGRPRAADHARRQQTAQTLRKRVKCRSGWTPMPARQ